MPLKVGTSSLAGPARTSNQDCIATRALAGGGLLVCIADGLGGYDASAEASALACDWVSAQLAKECEQGALTRRALKAAVQAANLALWQQALDRATALKTTLSVLVCLPGEALLAHIGDCRVTLVREGIARQLTRDHSWSRDLGVLGWVLHGGRQRTRHVLHRALGDQPMVRVDTARVDLRPGDRFVLCSDGVWGNLSASAFAALVMEPLDDQSLAERLTREALASGGSDDASAAVVSMQGSAD